MRWPERLWFVAVVASLPGFVATGCASDCQVICGKLEFCGLLVDVDRSGCMDRCEDREDAAGDLAPICASCVEDASCRTVANAGCSEPCAPLISGEVPQGGSGGGDAGGSGGSDEGAAGGSES